MDILLQIETFHGFISIQPDGRTEYRREAQSWETLVIGPDYIRTAHGYLSFQPDGRIEFRPTQGPWETLRLIGLPAYSVPNPPPTPTPAPPPPNDDWPAPRMSRDYIADVKAKLEAMGVNLLGPCGAFKITKRVAWGLRAAGAGLLSKTGGNNCDGYATDIIAFKDRAYDILSDGGATNGPTWNETGVDDLESRWRPAIDPS